MRADDLLRNLRSARAGLEENAGKFTEMVMEIEKAIKESGLAGLDMDSITEVEFFGDEIKKDVEGVNDALDDILRASDSEEGGLEN